MKNDVAMWGSECQEFFCGQRRDSQRVTGQIKIKLQKKEKKYEKNWMPQPNLACVWMFNLCVLLYDFIFSLRVATRFNTWWSERGDRDREGRDGLMCEFLVCVWFFFVFDFYETRRVLFSSTIYPLRPNTSKDSHSNADFNQSPVCCDNCFSCLFF